MKEITIEEAIELTGTSYSTLRRLIKESKIIYNNRNNKIYISIESLAKKFPHVQLIIEKDKKIEELKEQIKKWKRKASKKTV